MSAVAQYNIMSYRYTFCEIWVYIVASVSAVAQYNVMSYRCTFSHLFASVTLPTTNKKTDPNVLRNWVRNHPNTNGGHSCKIDEVWGYSFQMPNFYSHHLVTRVYFNSVIWVFISVSDKYSNTKQAHSGLLRCNSASVTLLYCPCNVLYECDTL